MLFYVKKKNRQIIQVENIKLNEKQKQMKLCSESFYHFFYIKINNV